LIEPIYATIVTEVTQKLSFPISLLNKKELRITWMPAEKPSMRLVLVIELNNAKFVSEVTQKLSFSTSKLLNERELRNGEKY